MPCIRPAESLAREKEALAGLKKEGGPARHAAIQELIGSLGGKLESYYFAFGADDVIAIAELPDDATCAALSFAVNASGAATATITVLLTPETVDAAVKKAVKYRPPGG